MDTNGALPLIGLLVCVGAIIAIGLLAFAFRALTGAGRNPGAGGPNMWNQRGPEQPRYDNPDIESRGGFGGVPNTGFDNDPNTQRGSTGGFGGSGAQTYNPERSRKDDDDIRSSGGFGNG